MLSPEAMREAPDGYEVRADGTVWNLASGRKLKCYIWRPSQLDEVIRVLQEAQE